MWGRAASRPRSASNGASGRGELGRRRERDEGPVVVEEQGEPRRRRHACDGGIERGARRERGRLDGSGSLLEPRDERARPAVDVVRHDALAQDRHPGAALLGRHRERAVERRRGLLDVVGVDEERLRQLGRGARELGKHEHAVAVRPRRHELLRDEVHPVAQRRDEDRVRGAVEGDELRLREGSVEVVDRGPARRGELALQPADHRLDLVTELAVGADVLARGDGHLHEPHLPAQLRVVHEERLERREPAGDPLRVVEPVDPEQELGAVEPVVLRARHDGGRLRHAREPPRVDAHREDAEPYAATVPGDPVHLRSRGEQAEHGRREVAHERGGVEADEIGAEHSLEELLALRQQAEDLGGGERDVEEEPDPRVGDQLAQEGREEHELVVVDPDEVARPVLLRDELREPLVDRGVRVVVADLLGEPRDRVVEERPEDRVRVPLVVPGNLLGAERYRDEPKVVEAPADVSLRLGREPFERPGPADPESTALRVRAVEPGREPTGAALDQDAAVLATNGDRQPVRDDEQARHGSLGARDGTPTSI